MHLNSEQFINGKISCSETDKSAYKFELSDEYNSGMVFRIYPKYRIRQDGEPVQYSDQIKLVNSKLDCFINFSFETPNDYDLTVS
mmetsp:Transcript_9608/g.8277  ORF Transcript_9608/g.8277 Transcript_9608/m.8277 type:complete len:85 (-) Transcript_9608:496-750(-)